MKRTSIAESALAALVADHLQAEGFEVYEEVIGACGRCDLVGVKGPLRVIVEVKTALSLALLSQVMLRQPYAHHVYAAAPRTRHIHDICRLMAPHGIGILSVDPRSADVGLTAVKVELGPTFRRRPGRLELHPEQRRGSGLGAPAGSNGGHWTPFSRTARSLKAVVAEQPGILFTQLVSTRFHYVSTQSARQSLRRWIAAGKVPGIALRLVDGRPTVWPTEVAP